MENQNEAKTNALGRTERSTHKENLVGKGILGGMVAVDLISGKEIKVAPGKMTHDQRLHLWTHQEEIVGKVVKYRSMDKGVKDQPRFARWIDFRSERDM
jgi:DNA ligase-1